MKISYAVLPLLLAGTLMTGCDSANDTVGRVIVRMTDAPVDNVTEINVSIASCEIINSSTDERETVPSTDDATMFNLLEYAGGRTLDVCVQDVSLPAFDQLRVVVGESAEIVIDDGSGPESHDLHIASGSSSGLKFFFENEVSLDGGTLDITLDFVADESVHSTGPPSAPTGYVMTPVIRVVTAELNEVELVVTEEDTTVPVQ